MSYKIAFALTAHNSWEVHQMNVKSAFLYKDLDEKIYMKLSDKYEAKENICKLHKFIYNLK